MLDKIVARFKSKKMDENIANYQFQSSKPKQGEIKITKELVDKFKKENPGNNSVSDFQKWFNKQQSK